MSAAVEQTLHEHDGLEDLLYEVFRVAATAGRPRHQLLAAMLGLTRGAGEYTPLEIATEAISLRRLAVDSAGHLGQYALIAKYEYPVDHRTRTSEQWALNRCARFCLSHNDNLRNPYFIEDCVRDAFRKKMQHDYRWWADHMDRSVRTLEYRWSKGGPGTLSVRQLMNRLLAPAEERFAGALHDRQIQWARLS